MYRARSAAITARTPTMFWSRDASDGGAAFMRIAAMFRPTPKILVAIAAGVFLLCALAADTPAFQGEPSGRERMAMTPFEAVLSADQRQALLSMVKADKAKLRALHQRLHKAREALIDKLLAPGAAVDVSKETAELKAAQAAMIDERVSIALAARKLLSAQQLKDA